MLVGGSMRQRGLAQFAGLWLFSGLGSLMLRPWPNSDDVVRDQAPLSPPLPGRFSAAFQGPPAVVPPPGRTSYRSVSCFVEQINRAGLLTLASAQFSTCPGFGAIARLFGMCPWDQAHVPGQAHRVKERTPLSQADWLRVTGRIQVLG